MEFIKPKFTSTIYSDDLREWVPTSFKTFIGELEHIIESCEGVEPIPVFRGQANHEWTLDSTFVRNCIHRVFALSDYRKLNREIRGAASFHTFVASSLLLKFGTVWKPSREAIEKEYLEDIDSWFELLKNLQQYPEKDSFISGTFLLDWSISKDVALYFATYSDKEASRKISSDHGALWICDAVATGKTLQIKKLGEILDLMRSDDFLKGERSWPLIIHPKRQTKQLRAINQVPVYIAQMDYRYDLADIWSNIEEKDAKRIFIKLILDKDLKLQADRYLKSNKITEEFIYPDIP